MASEVRAPRLQVTLNGAVLPGALAADVHSNNHFGASRFRVTLAAASVPQSALHVPGSRVEVSIGLDGLWTSLIVGTIDSVCLDPTKGVVDIEGRDLSSLMIEAQADYTFSNRTSSEIAQLIAGRHGLGSLVQPTSTPVGRYYQSEHDRVTLGQFAKAMTEWDLLAFLATQEGFDIFMQADALWFGPASMAGASVISTSDCISLQLDHAIGLARPIEVTVRSWGTKSGTAVTATAQSGGTGDTWEHSITRPNLVADEAQRMANQTLADLRRHEWTATVTMPGELTLTPRSVIAIAGTGTVWDRSYAISQLSRHLDVRRGFTQRLSLQGVQ